MTYHIPLPANAFPAAYRSLNRTDGMEWVDAPLPVEVGITNSSIHEISSIISSDNRGVMFPSERTATGILRAISVVRNGQRYDHRNHHVNDDGNFPSAEYALSFGKDHAALVRSVNGIFYCVYNLSLTKTGGKWHIDYRVHRQGVIGQSATTPAAVKVIREDMQAFCDAIMPVFEQHKEGIDMHNADTTRNAAMRYCEQAVAAFQRIIDVL